MSWFEFPAKRHSSFRRWMRVNQELEILGGLRWESFDEVGLGEGRWWRRRCTWCASPSSANLSPPSPCCRLIPPVYRLTGSSSSFPLLPLLTCGGAPGPTKKSFFLWILQNSEKYEILPKTVARAPASPALYIVFVECACICVKDTTAAHWMKQLKLRFFFVKRGTNVCAGQQ